MQTNANPLSIPRVAATGADIQALRETAFSRQDLLPMAAQALGETLVHQIGPHKGRPLGERRRNALLTRFISEAKASGRLVEVRPCVEANTFLRERQFFFVPHTADMFEQLRTQDLAQAQALKTAANAFIVVFLTHHRVDDLPESLRAHLQATQILLNSDTPSPESLQTSVQILIDDFRGQEDYNGQNMAHAVYRALCAVHEVLDDSTQPESVDALAESHQGGDALARPRSG